MRRPSLRTDARWRWALALATAAGALILTAAHASAHTNLVGSDPPDSAALSQAPSRVTLDFDHQVVPVLALTSMVDAEGRAHPIQGLSVDPARNTQLVVSLPPLPKDTYRLSYTVRDNIDLHITEGSIVFGVGLVPTLASQAPSFASTGLLEVATRWVALAGLCAVLGALVLLSVLSARLPAARALPALRRRVLTVAGIGTALVAVGDTVGLVAKATEGGSGGLGTVVTGSAYGERWIITLAATALLGIVIALLMRTRGAAVRAPTQSDVTRSPAPLRLEVAAAALAVVIGVVEAVSGHTGNEASPSAAGTLIRAVHILSVGVWAGGVAVLGIVLLLLHHADGDAVPAHAGRRVMGGFGRWAGPAFGAITVTGLLLAGTQVQTVTALLATAYGIILIVKVGAVAVAGALGARHALLVRRSSRPGARALPGRAHLTVAAEAAAAVVILLFASTLAASPPARGPEFAPPADAVPSAMSTTLADLVVRVELRPNRPGRNLLSVDVLNTRRPIPGPVRGVLVTLTRPGQTAVKRVVTAPELTPDTYDGGAVDLASAGEVGVEVSVARAGLPTSIVDLPWTVNPDQPAVHPTVVSSASLAPITGTMAVLVALAGSALLGRTRRRGPEAPARAVTAAPRREPRLGRLGLGGIDGPQPDAAPCDTTPQAALAEVRETAGAGRLAR